MSLQTLKGMPEILPSDIHAWHFVESNLHTLASQYGFEEIRTPVLEPLELFSRSVGEHTDIVQKEMFAFVDQGGTSMCLRPEGTASIVRSYIQHHLDQLKPITKLYYMGPMFRHERPQKGRLRQFHQFGVEALGKRSPSLDAEVIAMAMHIAQTFCLPDPILQINSLGNASDRLHFRKILQDYFSGFTEHLSEHETLRLRENPMRLLDSKNQKLTQAIAEAPSILDHLSDDSKTYFDQVQEALNLCGVEFTINPAIVRGLDYYCDTAFEIKVSNLGAQDTVMAGGRYDGLSVSLGGKEVAGIGFAMGLERLILSMPQTPLAKNTQVVVLALDPSLEAKTLKIVQDLRNIATISSIHLMTGINSLKSGLRAASKIQADHVLILGLDEDKKDQILWKNFLTQEQSHVEQSKLLHTLKEIV